jgi:hypothetical protein
MILIGKNTPQDSYARKKWMGASVGNRMVTEKW